MSLQFLQIQPCSAAIASYLGHMAVKLPIIGLLEQNIRRKYPKVSKIFKSQIQSTCYVDWEAFGVSEPRTVLQPLTPSIYHSRFPLSVCFPPDKVNSTFCPPDNVHTASFPRCARYRTRCAVHLSKGALRCARCRASAPAPPSHCSQVLRLQSQVAIWRAGTLYQLTLSFWQTKSFLRARTWNSLLVLSIPFKQLDS